MRQKRRQNRVVILNMMHTELMGAFRLPLTQIDYEDNKMKKDNLATLHVHNSNYMLSNLQENVS